MSRNGIIALRVFSGPQLGAELVLPEGAHILGCDDSCDIILRDGLAPRHARLLVSADANGAPQVSAQPLDGEIRVGDTALAADAPLPGQTPCLFGQVCLAWTAAEGREAAWETVFARMQSATRPVLTPAAPEGTPAPAEAPAPSANTVDTAGNKLAMPAPARTGSPLLRWALGLLVVLALCGLTITWQVRPTGLEAQVDLARKALADAAFQSISAGHDGSAVRLSGTLPDDGERGRLVRLAQRLHFPVYLDVRVSGDLASAVRHSFNSRELYPDVRELVQDARRALRITGYLKDGLVEEWALSCAREDVPAMTGPNASAPVTLIRDIRHADAVNGVLVPALQTAELDNVTVGYLPGKIVLRGSFTVEARTRLDAALDKVRAELGVPVVFEVREAVPGGVRRVTESPAQDSARAVEPEKVAETTLRTAFTVTGVTMEPMPFISLDNGEKVFAGGRLPDNSILETISVRELTLRKNGKRTLYPLRGFNE